MIFVFLCLFVANPNLTPCAFVPKFNSQTYTSISNGEESS